MTIAEEEIEAAKERSPRAARRLHNAFSILFPTPYTRGGEELYRRHCRELLNRVKLGQDVGPGTDAEVAFTFGEVTLIAPPHQDFALAYATVFARVFPEHAEIVRDIGREYVPGRHLEIIEEARKKIGRDVKRAITSG